MGRFDYSCDQYCIYAFFSIVCSVKFAEKSNAKYGNGFTRARGDLTRYKVSVAIILLSLPNFIAMKRLSCVI